jgi:hypothetical protein
MNDADFSRFGTRAMQRSAMIRVQSYPPAWIDFCETRSQGEDFERLLLAFGHLLLL